MRVVNISSMVKHDSSKYDVCSPVVFRSKNEWSKEEYDKMLQKKSEAAAKFLMIASILGTTGIYLAITKCKDKGGVLKVISEKIKSWFKKTN